MCSIIIGFVIYKVLNIIYNTKISTYKEFLAKTFCNKIKLINITNIIINLFLCITYFIMVSGFGTYFEQEFRNK